MGGRDHSCDQCGRGGMNDDRECICMDYDDAMRLLSDGFASSEVHPACIEFFLPEGVLTYWKASYDYGDHWTWTPIGALGQAVTKGTDLDS